MLKSRGLQAHHLSLGWWLVIIAAAAMWLVAIVPSGIDVFGLVVFTAPAAALGLFLRWASCMFARRKWNWRVATQAAVAAGMLLPPLLAALVTTAGLQRPEELLTLFVIGAWIALGVGMLMAALGSPAEKPRPPHAKLHTSPVSVMNRRTKATRE